MFLENISMISDIINILIQNRVEQLPDCADK